jgi:hypothetical protein
MKRVFLSLGIGFAMELFYSGTVVFLSVIEVVRPSLIGIISIPLELPTVVPWLFYSWDELVRFVAAHRVVAIIYMSLANAIIYSIPVYLILKLIKRKRSPAPISSPPPPPEFE